MELTVNDYMELLNEVVDLKISKKEKVNLMIKKCIEKGFDERAIDSIKYLIR